jgi:hypothetical protein
MSGAVAEQHVRKAIEFFRKYEKRQGANHDGERRELAERTPIVTGSRPAFSSQFGRKDPDHPFPTVKRCGTVPWPTSAGRNLGQRPPLKAGGSSQARGQGVHTSRPESAGKTDAVEQLRETGIRAEPVKDRAGLQHGHLPCPRVNRLSEPLERVVVVLQTGVDKRHEEG